MARLQRLESQIMLRPNSRNTKGEPELADVVVAETDTKQLIPPGGATYIRQGNPSCPFGADTIYSGVVAGSRYDHQGAAVDPLCLPQDPQYLKSLAGQGHHCMEQNTRHIILHWITALTKMCHVQCVKLSGDSAKLWFLLAGIGSTTAT